MRLKILLLILVVNLLPLFGIICYAITPQEAGYIVVTDYEGVDETGITDSTTGIQTAIEAAKDAFKPLFFPNQDDNSQAVYEVNATLLAEGYGVDYGGDRGAAGLKRVVMVGSTKGGVKPLIRLADNTFTDPDDPEPVIWFWKNCQAGIGDCTQEVYDEHDPYNNSGATNFFAQIRGIDFDLGDNSGAYAIDFPTGQGAMVSNLDINATDAFAGVVNAGVLGPAIYDVTIYGGRYAFYFDNTDRLMDNKGHPKYFGVRCYNQTQAVIYNPNSLSGLYSIPILFAGFYFKNNSAVPVVDGGYGLKSSFTFVDGIIDINATASFDIFQFDNDRSLYMRNVYTKGIDTIEDSSISNTSDWCWIKEKSIMRNPDEHNLVDGNSSHSGEVWNHEEGKTYTENQLIESLVDFHKWDYWDLPNFETAGILNVEDYGANVTYTNQEDDYNATQTALNDAAPNGAVFVPTGQLFTSATLTIPDNVALIGASVPYTYIRPMYSWQPNPSSGTPILQTDDDADASPTIAHLNIGAYWEDYDRDGVISTHNGKIDQFQFYSVNWRAGRNSQVINLNFARAGNWGANIRVDFPFVKVSGHGGGRWFSPQGKCKYGLYPISRSDMLIENTDEYMYLHGFNSHQDSAYYGIKILNSDNKFIYHPLYEGGQTSFHAESSNNIAVFGFRKNNNSYTGTGRAHVEIENCNNAMLVFRYGPSTLFFVKIILTR